MYHIFKRQLFLLHFAGGNSYSYNFLKDKLSEFFEFIPLELPGRGKRFQERLLTTKESAIQDYFNQIKSLRNDQPYLIYGHSMGATLGLSVTKCMENVNDAPLHLLVTGNAGPNIKGKDKTIRYLLNNIDFKEELRALGGVPEEVLINEELFDFFSPILRSDFEVLEKDNYHERGMVIQTPITAIMGDEEETMVDIDNWKKFTDGDFSSQLMKGNHFFIYNHEIELSNTLKRLAITSISIPNE